MAQTETDGLEVLETREWVDSLDYVLSHGGPNRAGRLLQQLALHARREAGECQLVVEGRPSPKWVFAGGGFFWLLFLYGLATTDYATRRNWPFSG